LYIVVYQEEIISKRFYIKKELH